MSDKFNPQQSPAYSDRKMLEQIGRRFYELKLGGTYSDLQVLRFIRIREHHLIFRTASDQALYMKWSEFLGAKQIMESSKN